MGQRVAAPADPTSEAVATTGLFLTFTAVIALAVCLASVGMSDVLMAVISGAVALLSFAASIVCFTKQVSEHAQQELSAGQMVPVPVR
jgi:hypothetical protein